jgi:excisionase family DNA binding protein
MAPMSPPVERRHLLTISEVAARLRVSERTVHRLIDRDELPSLQLGGRRAAIRIDESEFEAWLYGALRDAKAQLAAKLTEADDGA